MKSTPRGDKENLMAQHTRRRGRSTNIDNVARRNLAVEIADVLVTDDSSIKNTLENVEVHSSSRSAIDEHSITENISSTRSILSDSRYNLRSSARFETEDQRKNYKGVLTPSVAYLKSAISANRSIYRTPKIQSTVNTNKNIKIDKIKGVSKEQKDKWKSEIAVILNKTWKTSYLSTSVAFNYEKKNLKKSYESVLRARILEVFPAYHVSVKISKTSVLNQNPKENDGVFFIITTFEPGGNEREDVEPIIFQALLIRSNKVQCEQIPDSEWFPLLLYRGTELIHQTFINWLQASFGCYVSRRHFPQSCMLWLAGIYSGVVCSKKEHKTLGSNQSIHFHYIIRPPCTEKSFKHPNDRGPTLMKVEFVASDIFQIWNRLKDVKEKAVVKDEEIIKFHKLMETYMESLCHLPKALLQLYLLKTPCMTISSDGRLRLTCIGKFNSILQHLIEIFQETCHFNNTDFVHLNSEDDLSDEENE